MITLYTSVATCSAANRGRPRVKNAPKMTRPHEATEPWPPSLGTISPPRGSLRGYEVGVWFIAASLTFGGTSRIQLRCSLKMRGRAGHTRYGTSETCLSILLLERSCGGFHLRSGSCSGDHLADSSGNHFGMVKMNPVSAVARH